MEKVSHNFSFVFLRFLGSQTEGSCGSNYFWFYMFFLMFLCGFLDAFFVSVEHCDLFII